jgi:hypothetical protein
MSNHCNDSNSCTRTTQQSAVVSDMDQPIVLLLRSCLSNIDRRNVHHIIDTKSKGMLGSIYKQMI